MELKGQNFPPSVIIPLVGVQEGARSSDRDFKTLKPPATTWPWINETRSSKLRLTLVCATVLHFLLPRAMAPTSCLPVLGLGSKAGDDGNFSPKPCRASKENTQHDTDKLMLFFLPIYKIKLFRILLAAWEESISHSPGLQIHLLRVVIALLQVGFKLAEIWGEEMLDIGFQYAFISRCSNAAGRR